MTPGDILLAALPQAVAPAKVRPVLLLREMRPYGDLLVCGVTSKMHQEVIGFDERISANDKEFSATGLNSTSLIRLGYLSLVLPRDVAGVIGKISESRYSLLIKRLCHYLSTQS
jgi:mRNA interferase MazF